MRHLALDLGDRRIGVAVSDTLGIVARPVEVFERASRKEDFAYVADLIDEYAVEILVCGLPLNMDGTEGPQAEWVRDYTSDLKEAISIPLRLWDERLTTEDAKDILHAQGKLIEKDWLDAVAAAVILQNYLDAHPYGSGQE
jgi:putative holliday junction resolvase